MSSAHRKPEDTAEGCRMHAEADLVRAAASSNAHMRASMERSAKAWTVRAHMLGRLESSFKARVEAHRCTALHS